MNAPKHKSHFFDLLQNGDVIVISKHKAGVVNGIVSGLIIDMLSAPLLLAGLLTGIMMLVSVMRGDRFTIDPSLDHFASPPVVHAVFVILSALMGILFVGMAIFLSWLLWQLQFAVFPYESRLKKNAEGSWMLQHKLWFCTLPWRELGRDWILRCYPMYSRGDYGYGFQIRTKKRTFRLVWGGVFTESKGHAKSEATKNLEMLQELFGVPGEFKRWK